MEQDQHSKSIMKNIEQVVEQKKEVAQAFTSYYQQLLFCSVTVLAVFVTFKSDEDGKFTGLWYMNILTLCLLFVGIFLLTILLYSHVRVQNKAATEFMKLVKRKISNPSEDLTVIVKNNFLEKFAQKAVLGIFVLSMLSLLMVGLLKAIY